MSRGKGRGRRGHQAYIRQTSRDPIEMANPAQICTQICTQLSLLYNLSRRLLVHFLLFFSRTTPALPSRFPTDIAIPRHRPARL